MTALPEKKIYSAPFSCYLQGNSRLNILQNQTISLWLLPLATMSLYDTGSHSQWGHFSADLPSVVGAYFRRISEIPIGFLCTVTKLSA